MTSPRATDSFDDALDALADVQRRKLLVGLLDHNPQDDAPVVVDGEESDAFDRLVEMHHVHLPKMAEYGFVEWNREDTEVTVGPNFDEIRPVLDLLVDHEDELPPGWL